MTVFVSVASYRDPELVPTVLDCLAKAGQPDEVRVVVCWQHRGDEDVSAIAAGPRVELLDVDARDSRARAGHAPRCCGSTWMRTGSSRWTATPGSRRTGTPG